MTEAPAVRRPATDEPLGNRDRWPRRQKVMKALRTVGLFLLVASPLAGCSDDEPAVEILAESPTLPEDGTDPHAALATTDAELAEAWERFGFPGVPDVSLAGGAVLFIGTVESSSCPATIAYVGPPPEQVDVDADVFVDVGTEGGPECNTDANPVTLVVRAPDVAPVRSVFVASGNVTSPFSGQVSLDG